MSPHPPPRSDGTLWRFSSRFSVLPPGSSQPWGVWEWRFPVRIDYYLETIRFFCLFLFCAPRDKTWGGGGVDLQYSTYPCRNPYKVNFSLHKRRYFGRVFEASEGKCEASEPEYQTPSRLSQPPPHPTPFRSCLHSPDKRRKTTNACYVG